MIKQKEQYWTDLIATMSSYVKTYRPAELRITGVDWILLKKKKIVPVDIRDMLHFDFTIPGVRQARLLVQENDTVVSKLVQYHFAPKLVCSMIMDFLDDTSRRCTVCIGTIQLNQLTPCEYCGKIDRLVHPGCHVYLGTDQSLCRTCINRLVWCDNCDHWFDRIYDPRYCLEA
jgi:hypothetical protein